MVNITNLKNLSRCYGPFKFALSFLHVTVVMLLQVMSYLYTYVLYKHLI
jgi:hypothetical protein